MENILGFAGVVVVTTLALFVALAIQAALLRATVLLMQPAVANRPARRTAVEQGTRMVARAFPLQR